MRKFLSFFLLFFYAALAQAGPIIMSPTIDTSSGITFTDSTLINDGANILAQKNGTNAQIFRVYKTNTNAEWVELNWQLLTDVATIRTATSGGTARVMRFNYGGTTNSAISFPIAASSPILVAGQGASTVNATGQVDIGQGTAKTATSGTDIGLRLRVSYAPTATSTMAGRMLALESTINYSNGTPGAGSWEAISARITETANPTGTNYFFHFLGGAAGATEVAALTSAGELSFAGISGDVDTAALCKKADDTIGTCTSVVGATGLCTCG